ncbi:MAG: hypothetical protein ACXV1K_05490 [Kineosporiaceae bacterium]
MRGRAESAEVARYLQAGSLLRLGTARAGPRTYVAVRGALAVPAGTTVRLRRTRRSPGRGRGSG